MVKKIEKKSLHSRLLIYFEINFFKKLYQEYHQIVKQFGSRAQTVYKNYQQTALAGKELTSKIKDNTSKVLLGAVGWSAVCGCGIS